MEREQPPPGVGPEGRLSEDLLDIQALLSYMRDDWQAARIGRQVASLQAGLTALAAEIGDSNPAIKTTTQRANLRLQAIQDRVAGLDLDARLDAIQERIRILEAAYYERSRRRIHRITHRRKQGEGE